MTMKLERLEDGTWTINGVKFGPVDKQPRELPAQPLNPDQLPVRVTMRNGQHYTAHDVFPEERVHCVSAGYRHGSFAVGVDGRCEGRPERDIIRVGKWLTAEELEETRYDLPTM